MKIFEIYLLVLTCILTDWELRNSFKDIKRGVFRFFPRKGLRFFFFLRGGQTPSPKKAYISLIQEGDEPP